jgi:hypothetical protein
MAAETTAFSWCVWPGVFRRDHVREDFETIWCLVYEHIFFYIPIELAERGNEIIADEPESVVFDVGGSASVDIPDSGVSKEHTRARVLGIKIFRR